MTSTSETTRTGSQPPVASATPRRVPFLRDSTRQGILRGWLLPGVFVAVVVLLATVAGYNHNLPVAIAADTPSRQVFDNFHATESNDEHVYRWTSGYSGVCLAQIGRVPRTAASVTVLGDGAIPLGVDAITLYVNDQPLVMAPLRPATVHYHVLLAGEHQRSDDRCVTIASETVQPPGEMRQLGVPFQAMELHRLDVGGVVRPAALQVGLNLLLAALCFVLLYALGISTWWAAIIISVPTALLGLATYSGVVIPGIEATMNQIPLVGGLLVAIAGAFALRFVGHQLRHSNLLPARWRDHVLLQDLLLMAFWSLVLWWGVRVLQLVHGHHGVWPLKAGVWPGFTPMIIIPAGCFVVWLALVLRRLWHVRDEHSTPPRAVALALLLLPAGAIILPVVLKVRVRGWDLLYYTFSQNPTDYILDVPRVGNPITFLGQYVEISPTLAWHNANHPPGAVLLLWAVAQTFGPGPVIATWVAICLSSLAALAAFWPGLRLGGLPLALLAGALFVAMPYHNVYSVTSMDGVFNATIALSMAALFLALEPGTGWRTAALAGLLVALGLFFTYAATQLVFFGAALFAVACWRQRGFRHPLRQAFTAAAVFGGFYLLLYLLTGFNVIEGALQATENNSRFIERGPITSQFELLTPPALDHYVYFFWVNIVPFGWYLAPWGLAALTPLFIEVIRSRQAPTTQGMLMVGLVALLVGMWFSGLFIREVERIWGFIYPLAAVLMAVHIWQGTPRERIWRSGLYITLFFVQSAVMRMLLNTYW